MYQLVTTSMQDRTITALLDQKDQLVEVMVHDMTIEAVGDCYIGVVEQIKSNINGAFVSIGNNRKVFVSLDSRHIFYAKRVGTKKTLVQGDQVLVQIDRAAHKSKLAKASLDISLPGKWVVLASDADKVMVSSKIEDQKRRVGLKRLIKPYLCDNYGFIIRTVADEVEDERIVQEVLGLISKYERLMEILPYRSGGTKVYQPVLPFLKPLMSNLSPNIQSFLYDDPSMLEAARSLASEQDPSLMDRMHLWDGNLFEKYGLSHKMNKLLMKKIYLKSGASIVIEHTEALTVVDVNTEKTLSKKGLEETILKTNLEAAKEICRQIRARNLSGIIVVDFIDMVSSIDKEALMCHLEMHAKEDPIKLTVVDMTALGLVEMTRKKIEPPLYEQMVDSNLLISLSSNN